MFVQIIEGKVVDPAALRRQLQRWDEEVRPGAIGFLGSTAGVTGDGHAIALARFESADAAAANSKRPEQDEWWSKTEPCFDGPVTFSDSEDVDVFLAGGSDRAGFVQIMKGHGSDRELVARLDRAFEAHAPSFRPDVIGGLRVWTSPDSYVEAVYFTSETEARANEQQEPPAELAAQMADFESVMADVEFHDLTDPWFH
jgi:hypothetical protein